jgi:hypothetical protein
MQVEPVEGGETRYRKILDTRPGRPIVSGRRVRNEQLGTFPKPISLPMGTVYKCWCIEQGKIQSQSFNIRIAGGPDLSQSIAEKSKRTHVQ